MNTPWMRANINSEMVTQLESSLQGSLRPVNPDPAFVHQLRYRLLTPPGTALDNEADPIGPALLVGGSILGIAVFLVIARQLVLLVLSLLNIPRSTGEIG